jgi:hypothetical protein
MRIRCPQMVILTPFQGSFRPTITSLLILSFQRLGGMLCKMLARISKEIREAHMGTMAIGVWGTMSNMKAGV